MNECFLMGNILEEVNFKFILNGKNDSIATFKLQLLDNELINIIAYNEKADYCFRELKKDDNIFIYGHIGNSTDGIKLIAQYVYKLKNKPKGGKYIE